MRNLNYKLIVKTTIALSFMAGLNIATASASKLGVVGLFQVENQEKYSKSIKTLETQLSQHDCRMSRHGIIADEAGDIDIEQPNRFLILACKESVVGKGNWGTIFEPISSASNSSVILEGLLTIFPEDNSPSDITDRAYILKVSHYNNESPVGRERDLKTLRNETLKVADRYRRDIFIDIDRAIGMETPDEVALIYYENPEQGDKFRENNPDILEKVGAFNKTHLNDHVYYFGMAIE